MINNQKKHEEEIDCGRARCIENLQPCISAKKPRLIKDYSQILIPVYYYSMLVYICRKTEHDNVSSQIP